MDIFLGTLNLNNPVSTGGFALTDTNLWGFKKDYNTQERLLEDGAVPLFNRYPSKMIWFKGRVKAENMAAWERNVDILKALSQNSGIELRVGYATGDRTYTVIVEELVPRRGHLPNFMEYTLNVRLLEQRATGADLMGSPDTGDFAADATRSGGLGIDSFGNQFWSLSATGGVPNQSIRPIITFIFFDLFNLSPSNTVKTERLLIGNGSESLEFLIAPTGTSQSAYEVDFGFDVSDPAFDIQTADLGLFTLGQIEVDFKTRQVRELQLNTKIYAGGEWARFDPTTHNSLSLSVSSSSSQGTTAIAMAYTLRYREEFL